MGGATGLSERPLGHFGTKKVIDENMQPVGSGRTRLPYFVVLKRGNVPAT